MQETICLLAPNTGVATLSPLFVAVLAILLFLSILGVVVMNKGKKSNRKRGLFSFILLTAFVSTTMFMGVYATNTAQAADNCHSANTGNEPQVDVSIIAPNAPIQTVTPLQCQSLPVYDGGNQDAVRVVTDTRDGIARTYHIAKLADNNCWMLDNLKLGSETGPTVLTPVNSDVSQNFTLPQVAPSHAFVQQDKDIAYVWGPVPGDTGEGPTNYGYLYSWPASTAGATRSSHPAGSGNAANSICPAGWRLPSGGAGGDYSNLDIAFGGTGTGNNTTPSYQKWQYAGAFKGVFSGAFWPASNPTTNAVTGIYVNQGVNGRWWTATADAANADLAYRAGINTNFNSPANPGGGNRYDGAAVRCVLRT